MTKVLAEVTGSISFSQRGEKGEKGDNGVGVKGFNTYYGLSSRKSSPPTDYNYNTLSDTIIKTNSDMYVWSADKVLYTDGTGGDFINAYCIGKCSDLTSVKEQYGTSTSAGTPPSEWGYTYPSNPANGTYVWSRDEIVWAGDNSTTHSDAQLIGYIAVNGEAGAGMVVAYQQAVSKPTNKPLVTSYETYKNENTNNLQNNWFKSAPSAQRVLVSGGSVPNVSYNENWSIGEWVATSNSGHTWYKSPEVNHGALSQMRIDFTTTVDDQYVTFYLKAYSEENYDFILISKIDSEVISMSDYTERASGNGVEVRARLKCNKAGAHFVCVAYAKDVSGVANGDYGLVRMATNENYVYADTLLYRCDGDVKDGVISWGSIYQAQGDKGDKGDKGQKGDKGDKGALIRQHKGFESGQYTYYSGADNEDYLDVVYFGEKWYQCKRTYTPSSTPTSLDLTYWKEMNNFQSIATSLLLAKNAAIDMLGSSEINLTSGSMYGSFRVVDSNDKWSLWLGASTGDSASFAVTRGGAIKATAGTIGSFAISERSDGTFTFYSLRATHNSSGLIPACDVEMDYRGFNVWSGNNTATNFTKASLGHNGATAGSSPAWFNGVLNINGNVSGGASSEVVAIYTDITPKSGYRSYAMKAEQGDIWLDKGAFIGAIRPVVETRSTDKTLTDNDCCIICTNTSEITLTLPSSPQKGQMYMIYQANNAKVKLSSPTSLHPIISVGQDYPTGKTTWSSETHNQLSIIICGSDERWYVGYDVK